MHRVEIICLEDCIYDKISFKKNLKYHYFETGYQGRIWYTVYDTYSKCVDTVVIDFIEDFFVDVDLINIVDTMFDEILYG